MRGRKVYHEIVCARDKEICFWGEDTVVVPTWFSSPLRFSNLNPVGLSARICSVMPAAAGSSSAQPHEYVTLAGNLLVDEV